MAYRSFIGSCATLISSVVNLTVLMVLKGEPGWICLMCCNADILFSVIILHWVTQVDRGVGGSSSGSRVDRGTGNRENKQADPTPPKSRRGSLHFWNGSRIVLNEPTPAFKGSMTTEIKAAPALHRDGSDEDTIELRGIHVQTERTQEIQETEADARSERSTNGFACGQYAAERRVTIEKIV
jgi:hypothetical protein